MLEKLDGWLNNDVRRVQIFLAFVFLVFLTGGGSRPDIPSLLLLRPAACLFAGLAIWMRLRGGAARLSIPFHLLLALAGLHLVQLVPLPETIWSSLPGRERIAALDATAGMAGLSRPLTLSPATTTNSLFSLMVPIATFLLYGLLAPRHRHWAIRAILIAAAASCLLGLLQISGSAGNGFYLYRITNADSPVGLFANRNHQALFVAASIVLAAWSLRERMTAEERGAIGYVFDSGLIAVAVVLLMLIGSRGGVIFGAIALCAAAALTLQLKVPEIPHRRGAVFARRRRFYQIRRIASIGGLLLALGLVAAAVVASRDKALDRFFTVSQGDTIRGDTLPILKQLIATYFPFGSGFGTFEYVYKIVEPQTALAPNYLNEAHDDWLQIVIEGGLFAGLLVGAFAIWIARAAILGLIASLRMRTVAVPAVLVVVLFFGVSSAVDYPLRVPSLMMVFAILVEVLRMRGETPLAQGDGPLRPPV